jgi:hypothetical protein
MKKLLASVCLIAFAAPAFAAGDVALTAKMAFPESLTSTSDGTIYIGSMGLGTVYRAKPGGKATLFLSSDAIGAKMVLGVLADARSDTLWLCADGEKAMLKTYALSSGAAKKSYDLPGGGFCNDIALKGGDAYVSDTGKGRILKLAAGGDALTLWYQNDPTDASLDGLVWKGNILFTNTYNGNHLISVAMKDDGSAGKATVLKTSMPIYQPDGMRLAQDGRILMVEGRGEDGNGRVEYVSPNGDGATIQVIKDGYMLPTAVTTVGDTAYVLEAKLNYQRDPKLKDKDPGTFHAYAVPLNQ